MAKRVRISDDNGSNWYTLPGSSGELSHDTGEIDDTIFGYNYKSSEVGLIKWGVSSDALYKGFAGYVADVKKVGTTTAFTAEAVTAEGGNIYAIASASKSVWDRATTVVVKDGVTNIAAQIEWIDYLFGRVKLLSTYTVVGTITFGGNYFPMASIGKANGFSLTQTADAVQNTTFDLAQANGGFHTFQEGLKTVALELSGIFDETNGFVDAIADRLEVIVEINPDGQARSIARGFFRFATQNQSGDVGALEEEKVTLRLNVPDLATNYLPFEWRHTNTSTLNTAVKKLLSAWEAGTVIDVQYLPDGTTGKRGDCIVTELTLSGGLEEMNKFSVGLQGTGSITDVP